MTPLIDADILLHELGWSGEFKNKEEQDGLEVGEIVLFPFEKVQELLDEKIRGICLDVDATGPPILFITNSDWITKHLNRIRKYTGAEKCYHVSGYRYDIAKTKPYKGTRHNPKPYHFYNIITYLIAEYDVRISRGGLEADDEMCLYQTKQDNTIICSRDKDLRICPGWHYSWECGGQRSVGPHYTDTIGSLSLVVKEFVNEVTKKVTTTKEIKGYGLKFFFAQMLTGDTADNIPGLPKVGAVGAYNLLSPLNTEKGLLHAVADLYTTKMGDQAKTYFREQADLLWMQQEGKPRYKFGG